MRFPLKVQLVDSLAEFGRTRSLVAAGLLTGAAASASFRALRAAGQIPLRPAPYPHKTPEV